ncbi:MAG: hypothetical protein QHH74_09095 [Spirochaetota bacterium]|nr:hypothetical protein [Spirochaetota bacterium]
MKKIAIVLLFFASVYSGYALTVDYIFNEKQRLMLNTATDIIQASLGYDDIRELVYITFWSTQPDAKKIDTFNVYIAQQYKISPDDVMFIYERLLQSVYIIEYMADLAKSKKKWKFYYYYSDTLLPDTRRFCDTLKQAIIKADPLVAEKIDKRDAAIKSYAIDIVKYKEALYGGGF